MASSPGPTAADRASDVARRLEQSWIGPEHVLLALFDEPSVAAEALEELGVSRERSRRTPGAAAGATRPRHPMSLGWGCRPTRPGTS